jgi:hypothetical protein
MNDQMVQHAQPKLTLSWEQQDLFLAVVSKQVQNLLQTWLYHLFHAFHLSISKKSLLAILTQGEKCGFTGASTVSTIALNPSFSTTRRSFSD